MNDFCEHNSDCLPGDSINHLDNLSNRLHVDQKVKFETELPLKHGQRKRKPALAPDNEKLSKKLKLPNDELGGNFTGSDCDQSFPNEIKRNFHIKVKHTRYLTCNICLEQLDGSIRSYTNHKKRSSW